jgi:hypothetical protein
MSAPPNRKRARPQDAQKCTPSHLAAVAPSACWPASRICCLLPQSGDEVEGTNAFLPSKVSSCTLLSSSELFEGLLALQTTSGWSHPVMESGQHYLLA